MPVSDYTAGLATLDALPSPFSCTDCVNAIGLPDSQVLSPTASPSLAATRFADPFPPFGGTGKRFVAYTIGRYGHLIFGIGINVAGKFAIGPLALLNLLPIPAGVVPPSVYGLPENWLELGVDRVLELLKEDEAKVAVTQVVETLNEVELVHQEPIPVTITEIGPGGVLQQSIKGWLVDP